MMVRHRTYGRRGFCRTRGPTDPDPTNRLQPKAGTYSVEPSARRPLTIFSRITLDFYFGTLAAALFDFALLTAEWQHEMSEAFSYRIAVQFDPSGADHRFEFGFTVSTTIS